MKHLLRQLSLRPGQILGVLLDQVCQSPSVQLVVLVDKGDDTSLVEYEQLGVVVEVELEPSKSSAACQ